MSQTSTQVSTSAFAVKSIRSVADLEAYLQDLSDDSADKFPNYYSPDATFHFSGNPPRTAPAFIEWVSQVHTMVHEKLMLQKAVFNADKREVAAVIHIQFRGKEKVYLDNWGDRWGPVSPGSGPLVKAYLWYTLDKDGHILEAVEDAYPLQSAARES